jgi:hypothetical protein
LAVPLFISTQLAPIKAASQRIALLADRPSTQRSQQYRIHGE